MIRKARVDAMILAYHLLALEAALAETPRVPAWRIPVKEQRTRAQAKKRKAKRKRSRKARCRNKRK